MNERFQVIDEFYLKIIAFFSMAIDHIGLFLMFNFASNTTQYTVGTIFRIIGRLAFPLFVFFLSEGLKHTNNRKKYLCRLFIIWATIFVFQTGLYIYYRVASSYNVINAFTELGSAMSGQAFTDLLLYALFIVLLEQKNKKLRFLAILPAIYIIFSYVIGVINQFGINIYSFVPRYLCADYNLFGFLIFLGFYYSYNLSNIWVKKGLSLKEENLEEYQKTASYRKIVNMISTTFFLLIVLLLWGISYIDWRFDIYDSKDTKLQTYCLLDCFLLLGYSGKRGYDKKWWRIFEYCFYPLHIAIIALVFALLLR